MFPSELSHPGLGDTNHRKGATGIIGGTFKLFILLHLSTEIISIRVVLGSMQNRD